MEYWIDAADRLVEVDDDWAPFAIANGAPELASASILGRAISSFCSDATTREIWTQLLKRARAGAQLGVQIRCDAPDRRRLIDLQVASDEGRVRVRSTLVSEEPRAVATLFEPHYPQGETVLLCCSWCKKWRSPSGAWLEVEALVDELKLFRKNPVPRTSHGICESCRADFRGFAAP